MKFLLITGLVLSSMMAVAQTVQNEIYLDNGKSISVSDPVPVVSISDILTDLKEMALIHSTKKASFLLSKDQLIVNYTKQSKEMHAKLLELYPIAKAGYCIAHNYEFNVGL